MQGNCKEPDAGAALSLGDELAQTLLPLKPRQCLIMFRDTWLNANGGALWVDNVYLRFDGRQVESAFISAGPFHRKDWTRPVRSDLYITRVTFHAAPTTSLAGVYAGVKLASIYIHGAPGQPQRVAAASQPCRYMHHMFLQAGAANATFAAALVQRAMQWRCALRATRPQGVPSASCGRWAAGGRQVAYIRWTALSAGGGRCHKRSAQSQMQLVTTLHAHALCRATVLSRERLRSMDASAVNDGPMNHCTVQTSG